MSRRLNVGRIAFVLFAMSQFVLLALLDTSAVAPPPLTRTITEWAIPGCVNTTIPGENPGDPPFIIPGCEPLHPIVASSREIFFTERRSDKIGRLDPVTNVMTEWPLPTIPNPIPSPPVRPDLRAAPHGIVKFERGVLFCETGKGRIGFLDPVTNELKEWQVPFFSFDPPGPPLPRPVSSSPLHPDPKGQRVYFSLNRTNSIAALNTTTNQITEWPIPTPASSVNGVLVHGNRVFFAEVSENKIGMLDPHTNTITEWQLAPDSFPQHLVQAGRYVFFVESGGNKIGRLDPHTNVITEWEVPTPASNPADLDALDANTIIFAESEGNKIGQLKVLEECGVSVTVAPSVTPVEPTEIAVPVFVTPLTPTSVYVSPTQTPVPGIESCGFTEWTVPTPESVPVGIRSYKGRGAVFCESQSNKIGIIR